MKKSIIAVLFASIVLVGCATQPKYQCDPNKPETTPLSRFEINRAEGTAFDTKTKLTWKICAEGQSFSGGHCTGKATGFTWNNAMQIFGDEGNNWRLPNVDELGSIVERRCRIPTINMEIFPNAPSSYFWSGSSYLPVPSLAWNVYFDVGNTFTNDKKFNFYVRLVRGGQWFDPLKEEERKQAELVGLAERQKREAEQAVMQAAAQAEKDAYVTCNDKASCDKVFSLAQIYINSMASQKIQVATDTIIETYNPTEYGNIGMGAVKIPGKGSSAIIRLSVTCKVSDSGHFENYCRSKKLDIYKGFRPFVNKMLGD